MVLPIAQGWGGRRGVALRTVVHSRIFRALLLVVTNMSFGVKLTPVESHWSSSVHYAPLGINSSPLPTAWILLGPFLIS